MSESSYKSELLNALSGVLRSHPELQEQLVNRLHMDLEFSPREDVLVLLRKTLHHGIDRLIDSLAEKDSQGITEACVAMGTGMMNLGEASQIREENEKAFYEKYGPNADLLAAILPSKYDFITKMHKRLDNMVVLDDDAK